MQMGKKYRIPSPGIGLLYKYMIKNGDSTYVYCPRFYLQRPKKWLTEQLLVVNTKFTVVIHTSSQWLTRVTCVLTTGNCFANFWQFLC